MEVELTVAEPADTAVLRRLMQLYLYDLAAAGGWDVRDDGTFGDAAGIEALWTEPGRTSFLIRVDGKLGGFVLIRKGTLWSGADAHEIGELFVLRRYRRRGVGRRAAVRVFDALPGVWEVAQMHAHVEAQAFWRSVIRDYTGDRFEEFCASNQTVDLVVQRFDTTPRSARSGDPATGAAASYSPRRPAPGTDPG